MTLHQKVRALKTSTVTGLRIKRGTCGVVKGRTEYQDPPLVWVYFPGFGEVAMPEKDLEVVKEK